LYFVNTLKEGDVIAFDPMLARGSRRQYRFDIGQVVRVSYPYEIEVSIRKSITSSEFIKKPSVWNIHKDADRFKFVVSPIMQNKIVLSDEIFTKITKKNYKGI
jgi:hypothetical protein